MLKWKKLGLIYNPYNEINRPEWRYNFAQGQNVLLFDKFIRVYFCCREKPDENYQTISRITYLDLDRNNLKKIIKISDHFVLDVGGLGEFDEFGLYPFTVVRKNGIIHGYYGGVTRCESVPFNVAIGGAFSIDDGDTFQKMGSGPVLGYSLQEPFVVCSPKIRIYNNMWYMFYSSGKKWSKVSDFRPEINYKLRMAISADGINWTKINRNIIPDKLGIDEAQACGDVIFKNGKYHMFYCYRNNVDFRTNPKNSYRIGYAYSEDLLNWERKDDYAGIGISSNTNDFDSQMIAYPNVFEVDDEIYMLYLGNEVGKYGFGLAQLQGVLE